MSTNRSRQSSPPRRRRSLGCSPPPTTMREFLMIAAAAVLVLVALGLVRILRGPGDADRMMAAQLLGTGGIAALLLADAAAGEAVRADVALILALLCTFASIAFVKKGTPGSPDAPGGLDER